MKKDAIGIKSLHVSKQFRWREKDRRTCILVANWENVGLGKSGESFNLPKPTIKKFIIVFDELLSNIISYAYDDDKDHQIEIIIQLRGEQIVITITDDGIPFNPFATDMPDIKQSIKKRSIGGLGIHIVKNLMDEGEKKIIINLEKTDYLSSSGLRVFLGTAKKLTATGGAVKLCCPNDVVKEILEISGFTTILDVKVSEEEALKEF